MKICEMVDVEAWARLMKIIRQMRPKFKSKREPMVQHRPKAMRKQTDFEQNSSRLRGEVARLKAKSPIIPVSIGR